ncbi:AraC family transcriptional regulator [Paenibacillus harenae]|uniref:AraC family transcriptional regulator of arabinose operon n=1 Tax=Paenibacillus harenae TaxID=306543 RepID=A0ABT9TZI9_PAEHA|nr:AraC family transcriptional regulator [Paenibacillus harenae]MDQ0112798.1 AraC family transcriptional regulator of arabinose operon [Paenibacillus harenae]
MIQIKRCGYNVMHEEGFVVDRPEGSGDYLFLLFRSKMEIESQGKRIVTEQNSYILFSKGSKQYYRVIEQPMVHDWFHFDSDEMDELCEQLQLPLDTIMTAHDPFYISRKVSELQSEHIHNGPYKREIMEATVRCLLMKLSEMRSRIDSNHQISKHYDQFINLRNMIYNTPSVSYSVNELAASMNMSRSHFQQLYKEIFGVSVINDVIHNRLEYALYLLENSPHDVKTIAELCGYDNEVHFMRQFKKSVRLTPTEYRRIYRSPATT